MHEFAVCRGLMRQVERVARDNDARIVRRIVVSIGALSGVEADLLQQAFAAASAGTLAEGAVLDIEAVAPRVHCLECGAESLAATNRLVCGQCGDWRVLVVAGEEMLLKSVEIERAEETSDGDRVAAGE